MNDTLSSITGLISILEDGGGYALAAILLVALIWTDRRKNELYAIINKLQEKRVQEAQLTTKEVTEAIVESTRTLEAQGHLIQALFQQRHGGR